MTKKIFFKNGKYTLVDDSDYDDLSGYCWYLLSSGYVARQTPWVNKNRTIVLMHRQIMNPKPGMIVDHIDRNPLNNTKSNLRVCSQTQNHGNRVKQINNKSGYKGVCFCKAKQTWMAQICIKRKVINLGYFNNPVEGAIAYDKAALELFGEFALINFPKLFPPLPNMTVTAE
jgi:hypothetical protein